MRNSDLTDLTPWREQKESVSNAEITYRNGVPLQKSEEYEAILNYFCKRFPETKKYVFSQKLYRFLKKRGMIKLWFKLFRKGQLDQKEIYRWLRQAMDVGFRPREQWCWVRILNTWNDEKLLEQHYDAILRSIKKRRDDIVSVTRAFLHYQQTQNPHANPLEFGQRGYLDPEKLRYGMACIAFDDKQKQKAERKALREQKKALRSQNWMEGTTKLQEKWSSKTANLICYFLELGEQPACIRKIADFVADATERPMGSALTNTIKLALKRLVQRGLVVKVSRGLYDCIPQNRVSTAEREAKANQELHSVIVHGTGYQNL